jgi:flagellar hook-basal body complex protein FliE
VTILNVASTTPLQQIHTTKPVKTPYEAQQSFANVLKNAINEVNDYQIQSDQMTNKLIRGENVELHDVMIAAQKASITLNATVEVRNKVIDAYQEIMRMNI